MTKFVLLERLVQQPSVEQPQQQLIPQSASLSSNENVETGPSVRPAIKFDPKHPPPNAQLPFAPMPKTVEVFGPPRVTSAPGNSAEIDDTCFMPPDTGPCFDYTPRWFYNSETSKCETFPYGSCGGNANNFMDKQNCEAKCQFGK